MAHEVSRRAEMRAVAIVNRDRGIVDVPYTMTLSSKGDVCEGADFPGVSTQAAVVDGIQVALGAFELPPSLRCLER